MEVKDEVLVEALNRQVQQEKMLSDAFKNILSVSTEGKVSEFQQSVCDHMRKLELGGVGEYIGGTRYVKYEDTPFIYNLHQAPVVYGAKREGMPGLSMYGTVVAFALADQMQELKGKPLNQVAMHALPSGNYKALETMQPYDNLVEPLKEAMAKLSVLRVTASGGEYNETSWLKDLKSDARSYQTGMLEIGLRRIKTAVLSLAIYQNRNRQRHDKSVKQWEKDNVPGTLDQQVKGSNQTIRNTCKTGALRTALR